MGAIGSLRLAGRASVLAIVLIAAALGFWLFVQSHLNQIHEFNIRELGHAAHALESSVLAATEGFKKWDKAQDVCVLAKETDFLKFSEAKCACLAGVTLTGGDPALDEGRLRIQWSVAPGATRPPPTVRCPELSSKYYLDVQFDRILQGLAFPESFGLTFIAAADGKVVYQSANRREHPLRKMGWLDERVGGAVINPGASRKIGDLAGLTGGKLTLDQLKSGTTRSQVSFAGSSQYLYLQPLDLQSGKAFIGGMVNVEDATRRAFAVDSYLLIGLVLAAALMFLGRPFFKVLWLSPRERYKTYDAYELIFSAVALVVLFTVLIMAAGAYWKWRDDGDRTMASLAGDIENNLKAEIKAARAQLQTYDKAMLGRFDIGGFTEIPRLGEDPRLPPPFYWPRQIAWARPNGCQFLKSVPESSLTPQTNVGQRPYFRAIATDASWMMAGDGKDDKPFMLHPGLSITDGQYYTFLSIKSDATMSLSNWMEVLPEKNCGSTESLPGAGPVVAAMTLDLRSATNQPLPTGYGFAIVNRLGHALYENDGRRALREDLVEEVNPPLRLSTVLQSDSERFLTVDYQARNHRFYVRPLSWLSSAHGDDLEPRWFLVVHRDLAETKTVTARITVLSLLYAMVAMFVLGVASIAIMCRVSSQLYAGRTGAWLWPHEGRTPAYIRLARLSLGLLAAELVCLAALDGTWLLPVALLGPLIVGVFWIHSLLADRNNPEALGIKNRRPLLEGTRWFVASTVLFVLCFALPLAGGFFKLFWNDEIARITFASAQDRGDGRRAWIAEDRERLCQEMTQFCQERAAVQARFLLPALPPPAGTGRAWAVGLADWLPMQDDLLARVRYSPRAPISSGMPGGGWPGPLASLLFVALVAAIALWARAYADRMLLARSQTAPPPGDVNFDSVWPTLSDDKKVLLLQISSERMSNPRARELTRGLLREGLLTLAPDLQPVESLRERLRLQSKIDAASLASWEKPGDASGWNYMRWVMWFTMAGILLFLLVTQPDLPGQLNIAAGITTVAVTNIRKLFDAIGLRMNGGS